MSNQTAVLDLSGTRAVVTGANSGLGLGLSHRLAAAGAEVVMAARTPSKGEKAVAEVMAAHPGARVSTEQLDVSDLSSVRAFAGRMIQQGTPIDLLVNNAGIMATPTHHRTVDGFELQFATNHLGHFALTGRLLPLLRSSASPRVVALSSIAARTGKIDFDDLNGEKIYKPWKAYGQSKLANLMFALELDRLSRRLGWGITAVAAHPGVTHTNLQSTGPTLGKKNGHYSLSMRVAKMVPGIWQEVAHGVLPPLFAATSPDVVSGGYYGPDGFLELTGSEPTPATKPRRALDENVAERLWEVSEGLTTVRYPLEQQVPDKVEQQAGPDREG